MLPEDIGITRDLDRWAFEIRVVISLAFIAGVMLVRWLLVRMIRRQSDVLTDSQRWWISSVRNSATAVILIGLIGLWSLEIEEFALSITAFAVALVIGTKELLLCFSGAAWRAATRAFDVGDWVRIGPHSGEVIDETMLVTQLQEIDPVHMRYTGRSIAVPNALLLTNTVVNENFRKRYLFHEFTLYSQPNPEAERVRDAICAALTTATADFAETAHRYAAMIGKRTGLQLPEVEPKVWIGTTDLGNIAYRCALFCPRERAVEMEQIATGAYLAAGGARAAGS